MRSFIAIDTNLEIKEHIQNLIEECSALQTSGIKYSQADQLHITLHFLGEIPDSLVDPLIDTLAHQSIDTDEIVIEKCGAFPDFFFPKVAWLGVQRSPGLLKMYAHIESVLASLNISPERLSFKPHISFARFTKEINKDLLNYLRSLQSKEWARYTPLDFHLYKSELRKEGSLYTKLATFNLRSTL